MMKKAIQVLMTGLLIAVSSQLVSAEVTSLRGAHDLDGDALAITKKKVMTTKGGFKRSFEKQPPLIPHSVEKDEITLRGNTCMRCHSKENHEKEKAPVVGESHFLDRDGKLLEKLSSRRYFCNQCHVPQLEAQPLVKNNF
jgi:cytochrome c-type protein NapB